MLKQISFIIISVLIFISCGKNNQPEQKLTDNNKYNFDSSDVKTEGVDNSGKPFVMQYKFKKGDKYTYRLTTISDNTQKLLLDTAVTSKVDQKIVYLMELEIKDVDTEGVTEAEMKMSSIKLEARANGQTFNFEAGKDVDSTKITQFAEFQAMYNNPFSLRFNKQGEILEVYKVDKISDKFLDLKGAKDTISAQDKNLIKMDLINSILNPLVTQIIRKFPDKEVYKDSTWEIHQTPLSMMVYQINYVNKYKLESVEKLKDDRIAVIDAGIAFTYTGNPKVTQGTVSYTFEKPISTAEGKIFFDVDKGIQVKSKTKTRLQITYSMEANTPQGKQKGTRTDIVGNTNIIELL